MLWLQNKSRNNGPVSKLEQGSDKISINEMIDTKYNQGNGKKILPS
jgi:hypothetical protein